MIFKIFILSGLAVSVAAQTTCTAYSAPAGACPTAFDTCCGYLCQEAQVPFSVCQETDGTGLFATCSACPGAPVTTTTTTFQTDTMASTTPPTDTATVTTDPAITGTTTLTSTTTICTESGIGNYTGVLPTPTYVSGVSKVDVGMVESLLVMMGLMVFS